MRKSPRLVPKEWENQKQLLHQNPRYRHKNQRYPESRSKAFFVKQGDSKYFTSSWKSLTSVNNLVGGRFLPFVCTFTIGFPLSILSRWGRQIAENIMNFFQYLHHTWAKMMQFPSQFYPSKNFVLRCYCQVKLLNFDTLFMPDLLVTAQGFSWVRTHAG